MSAPAVEKYPRSNNLAVLIALKAIDIEPNALGVVFKNRPHIERLGPGLLVFVKEIVHLEEFALQAGGLGYARGGHSVRVRWSKRELAKDDLHSRPILTFKVLQ